MIRLLSVGKQFDGRTVVKDVSFEVDSGRCVGIWGPNGVGKTTLLEIIGGLERPSLGTTEIDVAPTEIGYVPQHPIDALLPWYSCHKNAMLYRTMVAEDHLLQFGISGKEVKEYPARLSGGTLQRLVWAFALRKPNRLFLLDEAFAYQDHYWKETLIARLRTSIVEEDKMAIIVAHDPSLLVRTCDEIVILEPCAGVGKVASIIPIQLNDEERIPTSTAFHGAIASILKVA